MFDAWAMCFFVVADICLTYKNTFGFVKIASMGEDEKEQDDLFQIFEGKWSKSKGLKDIFYFSPSKKNCKSLGMFRILYTVTRH